MIYFISFLSVLFLLATVRVASTDVRHPATVHAHEHLSQEKYFTDISGIDIAAASPTLFPTRRPTRRPTAPSAPQTVSPTTANGKVGLCPFHVNLDVTLKRGGTPYSFPTHHPLMHPVLRPRMPNGNLTDNVCCLPVILTCRSSEY